MANGHASIGPSINIPEAMRGMENESTPMDQRVPDRTTEMSKGPNISKNGSITTYNPSRYEHTVHQKNGEGQMEKHTVIIEDR